MHSNRIPPTFHLQQKVHSEQNWEKIDPNSNNTSKKEWSNTFYSIFIIVTSWIEKETEEKKEQPRLWTLLTLLKAPSYLLCYVMMMMKKIKRVSDLGSQEKKEEVGIILLLLRSSQKLELNKSFGGETNIVM